MRISDWSSDVCSSDLTDLGFDGVIFVVPQKTEDRIEKKKQGYSRGLRSADAHVIEPGQEIGRAPWRERGCQYEEISVGAVYVTKYIKKIDHDIQRCKQQ